MADVKLIIREKSPVTLKVTTAEGDPYAGDYDVTPNFERQTLKTRNRLMLDDVTVRAISVSRTTNPSGGKTIYIGEIQNG